MEQMDRTFGEGLRGPGRRGPWDIVRCRSRGYPPAPDSRSRPSLGRSQSLARACRHLWAAAGQACPNQPTLLGVLIESKTNQKSPGFAQVPRCCQVGLISASRGPPVLENLPSPTSSGGCTTLDLRHHAGLPFHPPGSGSCLAAGSGGRGSPARLLSGGRKCEDSCGQERKGPSGRRCLASNLWVPAMLKAMWKSHRDSRLQGVGRVSLGKHEGGRGSPNVPRDSICPREPDPAQGHCPHTPGQAGGASRDPRPQEAPEPRLGQEEGLQRGQDPLWTRWSHISLRSPAQGPACWKSSPCLLCGCWACRSYRPGSFWFND